MKMRRLLMLLAMTLWGLGPAIAGNVTFDYQGRVRVQGTLFNGLGHFKFAITNTSGTAALWTNDGTHLDGTEPTGEVTPITVTDGIFDVLMGDPAAGMLPINSSIFNSQTPLKLRTWFNDGANGFQQLNPDSNLANVILQTLSTDTTDFTIFVNGTTGNDSNNGLTTATAKKTVQGAVDIVPARLRCNVKIDIADGIYREEVDLNGISATRGKILTFYGDENWNPGFPGNPAVRITGTNTDVGPVAVRPFAVYADQCSGVTFRGILFNYASNTAAWVQNGNYEFDNCKAANSGYGFVSTRQSEAIYLNCDSRQHTYHGYDVTVNSRALLTSCSAVLNGSYGVYCIAHSTAQFFVRGNFSNNGWGIGAIQQSYLGFELPTFNCPVKNNTGDGIAITSMSLMEGANQGPPFDISGNGGQQIRIDTGAQSY